MFRYELYNQQIERELLRERWKRRKDLNEKILGFYVGRRERRCKGFL